MRVTQLIGNSGNPIKNQFLITDNEKEIFQSYDSIIIVKNLKTGKISLDEKLYKFSNTTVKYRNLFLQETSKQIEDKIKSGIYTLENLN